MKAYNYIVIGIYDSERNSWIPGGDIRHVCSRHHKSHTAWSASDRAHMSLGGCDGSDKLTDVMERYARVDSPEAQEILADDDTQTDWYEYAGWVYVGCDFWDHVNLRSVAGGIGYTYK